MGVKEEWDIGESLVETIGRSSFPDILQDVAELGLDTILQHNVLKDFPIISTLVGLGKTAVAIRDRILAKKVLIFLKGVGEIPAEERSRFAENLAADKAFRRRVGEAVVMLLDRFDHMTKAQLLAAIFGSYVKGAIDYDVFMRLSTSIDRAFIGDLFGLLDYFSGKAKESDTVVRQAQRDLFPSNLSSLYVLSDEELKQSGAEHREMYSFNQYGQQLARIVLGDKFSGSRL